MTLPSFSRVVAFLEVERPHDSDIKPTFLVSKDVLPVPPEERTWKSWNYVTFWFADSFNLSTFMIASSMVGAGLSWWQAWVCVTLGYSISAGFLVLNAYGGAKHHLIFGAMIRSSFGPIGGLWPVFNRAAMSIIWYGVQSYIGGASTYVLLVAIWPQFATMPNTIPNSGTSTNYLISFLLFSLVSLIPIYFPIHKVKVLFTIKAVVAPLAGFGLLGWCIARAGGAGPLLSQPSSLSGTLLAWTFVAQVSAPMGNMATLITNSVDFGSRANKPSAVMLPQLIAMPIMFSVVSLFGILIASSTYTLFGEFVWSPLTILLNFMDQDASSRTRAAAAFIAIGFIVAQLGTNIAANSITAGCDLTALFPRFINIRRGGYLAALVGVCMCPWFMAASSSAFANALSGYAIFLSSIVGVMVANYWVVSKRNLKVGDLYTMNEDGAYRYWKGINVRAYVAYIAGILINIVGFVGSVGNPVPIAASHIFDLSFLTGFSVSFVVFIVANRLFPVRQPTKEECDRDLFEFGSSGEKSRERMEWADSESFGEDEKKGGSLVSSEVVEVR